MASLPKPPTIKLSALALQLLEQAAAEARHQAIDRTLAHRLALAWLRHSDVAEPWQIEKFWKLLGGVDMPTQGMAQYCRDRDFRIMLDRWRVVAGLPPRQWDSDGTGQPRSL